MSAKLLKVVTIIWVLLVLFSPLRPDPLEQGANNASPLWHYIQMALMFAPYIALSFLMLNIKLRWIKETWFVNSLPVVLVIVAGLEIYSCLVTNTNGIGSWLTTGIAYLVVLWVARGKKPYSDGLMYGVIAAVAGMFAWEAIYQVLVHTKSNWEIGDNLTFFYSAIVCIPFVIILLKRKVCLTGLSKIMLLVFVVSFGAWAVSGFWTYLYYADSQWMTEPYSYSSYFITRVNKVALCAFFATLTYLPYIRGNEKLVRG